QWEDIRKVDHRQVEDCGGAEQVVRHGDCGGTAHDERGFREAGEEAWARCERWRCGVHPGHAWTRHVGAGDCVCADEWSCAAVDGGGVKEEAATEAGGGRIDGCGGLTA